MAFPMNIDETIRKRFESLISEGQTLTQVMENEEAKNEQLRQNGIYIVENDSQYAPYQAFLTKVITLIQMVLANSERATQIIDSFNRMRRESYSVQRIVGTLQGLQDDYVNGMLDSLSRMIGAEIASDYMGQAKQLLGEGVSKQYDHVPAAVLAGAVLEGSLRRLCQRHTPEISIFKGDGEQPKKVTVLIDELKAAGLYNELKAKQLRAWADIRNAAAHGRFEDFERHQVEAMISGIQSFLADHL